MKDRGKSRGRSRRWIWSRDRGKQDKNAAGGARDYGKVHFTAVRWAENTLLYLLLDIAVSYLFFRSAIAGVLLFPGFIIFLKERKAAELRRQKSTIRREFLIGIQFVTSSLQAGYSVENAFGEASVQLSRTLTSGSFGAVEFRRICSLIRLNRSLEQILMDLGSRSGVEDIENFSDVFSTARRSGGDLIGILQNTVLLMQQNDDTQREIETILAGKQMEHTLMTVIPMFILAYISLVSPGFLNIMYHNLTGILMMSATLALYLMAFWWGRRILEEQGTASSGY